MVQQDIVPKVENQGGLYTIYVRVEDAVGNDDVLAIAQEPEQDVGRIFDHVEVEPKDVLLIAQSAGQEIVPAPREDAAS